MLYTSANFTIRTELSALWDTDSPCLLVLCWSCVLCGLCQSPDTPELFLEVLWSHQPRAPLQSPSEIVRDSRNSVQRLGD